MKLQDEAMAQGPKDTDNLLPGTTPDAGSCYRLMTEYSRPSRIKHPLDEPVLISVLRSGFCYLVGLLVSVPVILALLALVIISLPVRIFWYVLATRCLAKATPSSKDSLNRILVGNWTHCDSIWPLAASGGSLSVVSRPNGSGDTAARTARIPSSGSGNDSIGSNGTHHSSIVSSPVSAASVAHCLVTLQGSLDIVEIREIIFHKVIEAADASSGRLLFPRFTQRVVHTCHGAAWLSDVNFNVSNHVALFRPGRIEGQVQTLDDLENFLNDLAHRPLSLSRPLWEVLVLSDFGDTKCTLLLFRIHSLLTETLCLPRLLCRLNDSELAFVNEPRLDPSFYQRVWGIGQMLSLSMMELPFVLCRRPRLSVWTHVRQISKSLAQQNLASSPMLGVTGAGDSVQRPISVVTNCSNSSGGKYALPPPAPGPGLPSVRHVLTWARVPNVDQLLRAEKLLHCSVEELFLSFIAGAYNRHLKSNGVRHPPDVFASLPVSLDKWGCSSPDRDCCQCLVPVRLPVSVEGAIPRLWEVQKCLEDALDGSLPYSLFSLTYALEHSLIPAAFATSVTKCLLNKAHAASGCVVTFLRGSLGSAANIPPPTPNRSSVTPGLFSGLMAGTSYTASGGGSGRSEFSLRSHRIHSALFFQPLPSHVNSSFTFVVFGREILLSLTTDSSVFPSADALLVSFQDQIQKLLRQVSGRMISPIAAQLIAAAKPIIAAVSTSSSDSEASEEASSGDDHDVYHPAREQQDPEPSVVPKAQSTTSTAVDVDFVTAPSVSTPPPADTPTSPNEVIANLKQQDLDDSSLEELEVLTITAQNELERIRSNPYAQRQSNLARLAYLEGKMEDLHSRISDRIGSFDTSGAKHSACERSNHSTFVSQSPAAVAQVHRKPVVPNGASPSDSPGKPQNVPKGAPSRSLSMPHPLLRPEGGALPPPPLMRGESGPTPNPTTRRPTNFCNPVSMLEAFMRNAATENSRRHSFNDDFLPVHARKDTISGMFPRMRRGRSRRLSSPQVVVNSFSADEIFAQAAAQLHTPHQC